MKVITYAIAKGGVGKTILTANTAVALAEKGKKVLMVDCDLGSKSLSHIFNVNGSKTKIIETEFNNLDILPIEQSIVDAIKMDFEHIKRLYELDYDYVFIDSPATTSGVETYLALGVAHYFIMVLDYLALGPSLQGAINTLVIGKNYLECEPIGFVINNCYSISETVVNDIQKILGLPNLAIIKRNPIVEQTYSSKILAYYKDEEFKREIDKIVNVLEKAEDRKEKRFLEIVEKMRKGLII
ncbi:ParA family protein [Methanocaldococcus infernus]